MNEENTNDAEQKEPQESCGQGCCDSNNSDNAPTGGGFKGMVFLIVIILAGAVAAHSVMSKNKAGSTGTCPSGSVQGSGAAACCPADMTDKTAACPTTKANADISSAGCPTTAAKDKIKACPATKTSNDKPAASCPSTSINKTCTGK